MRRARRPVIVHVLHALEGGGTERQLVSLLHALDPTLLRHVVVTLRHCGSLTASLPDHAACRPIEATGRSWSSGLKLARLTRALGADVIHARNTGCWNDAIVARLLTPRARLVLGFHGLESARPFGPKQQRGARWGLRVGARFATVAKAGARQLQQQARVPRERIDLLPNGVDHRLFESLGEDARRRTRTALRVGDESFVVGTVGSLTPVKGHATLISAFADLVASGADTHLVIVGDGPLREELVRQTRRLGIEERVRFTGWCNDVPAMLSGLDAYVCASESEGMSNALLEAMASGLAIIATRVGDNACMVRDNIEGVIVESRVPREIAEALRRWAKRPGLRRRFAAAAGARAREYDFDRVVRRSEHYYEKLAWRTRIERKGV